MKNVSRILLFLSAIILLLFTTDRSLVLAQSDYKLTGFASVRLWIYPEYDDPRLLVMLEGRIVGVQAPVIVRFLVPSAAEMYSAGSMDAQGKYSGGPPNRQQSSLPGWDEISYEVKTNTFRVEYYDPSIIGQPDKSISYEFRRLYPISDLEVTIQEPRHATNFSISSAGKLEVDSEGFNSYLYNYSGLGEGTPLRFQITYTKSDTRPSLDIKDNGSSSSLLALIIVIVFGLAIVGIFYWKRKSGTKNRITRRQQAKNKAAFKQSDNQLKAIFCSQCDKPIAGSYKFCPYCGAKLL